MLTYLFLAIAVLIVAVLAIAATKPSTFKVKRSITISASLEDTFNKINNLKSWQEWSPWAKKDPNMTQSYGGNDEGIGAFTEWNGNKEVGQGRMEILDTTPYQNIKIQLNFLKPFKAQNTVEFNLAEHDNETAVTWVMYGPQPFINKIMSVFVSMDKMVGTDFENGLNNLRTTVENG